MRKQNISSSNDSISSILTNKNKVSSHCVIELSISDWNRLKANAIHLIRRNLDGGKSHYNDVVWGENLIP